VVAGAVDASPTVAHVRRMLAAFGPAPVTLHVQPDAGHYPWEDDAAAFSGVVGEWLTGL
jgi:pimeloyl-ACP methyl ester carboxylesterase